VISCVFGDWDFDPTVQPRAAYRAGTKWPLKWTLGGVVPVHPLDSVQQTVPLVALAAHWAEAHPDLLQVMAGPVEVDGFPRSQQAH
jgi:hypothetical protein